MSIDMDMHACGNQMDKIVKKFSTLLLSVFSEVKIFQKCFLTIFPMALNCIVFLRVGFSHGE